MISYLYSRASKSIKYISPASFSTLLRGSDDVLSNKILKIRDLKQIEKIESDTLRKIEISEEAAALKNSLPVFSFVLFSDPNKGHGIKNVDLNSVKYLHIDIDKIGIEKVKEIKDFFKTVGGCLFAAISPSGDGLKISLRIKGLTAENYENTFNTFGEWCQIKFGVSIDYACSNINRLMYYTYDPDLVFSDADDYFELIQVGVKQKIYLGEKKTKKAEGDEIQKNNVLSASTKKQIYNIFESITNTESEKDIYNCLEKIFPILDFEPNRDNSGRNNRLFFGVVLPAVKRNLNQKALEFCINKYFKTHYNELFESLWLQKKFCLNEKIEYAAVKYAPQNISFPTESVSFEYDYKLDVVKYLGEKQDELAKIITQNEKVFLKAPTGAGKTRFILDFCMTELTKLKKQNGPAKHIIITVPNVVTAHNLYNDLIKRYPKKTEWVALFAGGSDSKNETCNFRFGESSLIICVVDKIYDIVEDAKHILENKHGKKPNELFINDLFHFAVIDEAHKMENDSSFRPVIANLSPFFLKGIPTIFITATPTTAFLKMCKTFKYTTICVNAADRQKYTINAYKSSSSKKIAEAIYSEYKNGKKCVARMGSKHMITLVNECLKELDPLLKILILRSEDKLDDDILEFSKTGKLQSDILLCTKLLEDGFSIIDKTDFAFFYHVSRAEIPDVNAIKQMAARARFPKLISLNIFSRFIGKYDDRDLSLDDIFLDELKQTAAVAQVLSLDKILTNITSYKIKNSTVSKIASSRFDNNGLINFFTMLRRTTLKKDISDFGKGFFIKKLENIFDEKVTKYDKTEKDENEEKEDKLNMNILKNNSLELLEQTAEAFKNNLDLFYTVYAYYSTSKRLKNVFVPIEITHIAGKKKSCEVLKDEIKKLGLKEEILKDPCTLKIVTIYNTLFFDTSNYVDKMNFVRYLAEQNGALQKLIKTRTVLLSRENKIFFKNAPESVDLITDLITLQIMAEYIEKEKEFNIEFFINYLKTHFNLPTSVNQCNKYIMDLFNIAYKCEHKKYRKEKGKPLNYRINCVLKDKEDFFKEFMVPEKIKQDLYPQLEPNEIIKDAISTLKDLIRNTKINNFSKDNLLSIYNSIYENTRTNIFLRNAS